MTTKHLASLKLSDSWYIFFRAGSEKPAKPFVYPLNSQIPTLMVVEES